MYEGTVYYSHSYNNVSLLLYHSEKRKKRERTHITSLGKHDEIIIILMCLIMLHERVPSPPLLDKITKINNNDCTSLPIHIMYMYVILINYVLIVKFLV